MSLIYHVHANAGQKCQKYFCLFIVTTYLISWAIFSEMQFRIVALVNENFIHNLPFIHLKKNLVHILIHISRDRLLSKPCQSDCSSTLSKLNLLLKNRLRKWYFFIYQVYQSIEIFLLHDVNELIFDKVIFEERHICIFLQRNEINTPD